MSKTIFIFLLTNVVNYSETKNELNNFLKEVHFQSKSLQLEYETIDNDSEDKVNFYSNFFLDGQNIFKGSIDNWEDNWDCGLLSLKKECITEVFKTEVLTVDENISCINQYGVNEALESSIIQSTTLIVKDKGEWKIVGSRHAHTNVMMMIYGLLNENEPKSSFTDRCFNSVKLKKWKKELVTDRDLYWYNPILEKQ